jgi:hypothetical protein
MTRLIMWERCWMKNTIEKGPDFRRDDGILKNVIPAKAGIWMK